MWIRRLRSPSSYLDMAAACAPLAANAMPSVPPFQHVMAFDDCSGVMIQQETNLFCRCCCCQPNINYRMAPHEGEYVADRSDVLATWYIAESASFWGRCLGSLFPGAKATTWAVHEGGTPEGRVIMWHEKGVTCSHSPALIMLHGHVFHMPWCCCLPYLTTYDGDGTKLGTTRYVCDRWLCVPKFDVFDAQDAHMFRVRSKTCCFGCCKMPAVRQLGGGRRRLRVPHQVRHPVEPFDEIEGADITDLWAGLVRQCCTKQELLGLRFPAATSLHHGQDIKAAKATLVGTTLLLNTLLYDRE